MQKKSGDTWISGFGFPENKYGETLDMTGEILSGEERPDVINFAKHLSPGAEQLFKAEGAVPSLYGE